MTFLPKLRHTGSITVGEELLEPVYKMSLRRITSEEVGIGDVKYPAGTLVSKLGRDDLKSFVAEDKLLSRRGMSKALGKAALVEFADGHRMVVSESDLVHAKDVTIAPEARIHFPDAHPHKHAEKVCPTGSFVDTPVGRLYEVVEQGSTTTSIIPLEALA